MIFISKSKTYFGIKVQYKKNRMPHGFCLSDTLQVLHLGQFLNLSKVSHWIWVSFFGEASTILPLQIMRYTLNMGDWTLKDGSPKDLIPDTELNHSFEFSNINPRYLGKKYR